MLAPTWIVIVEAPSPGAGMGFGLKLAVAPVGSPEADKLIELLKPPLIVVESVAVPWLPWVTVIEVGALLRRKLGANVTSDIPRKAMGV